MRRLFSIFFFTMCGCSSDHDLKRDGYNLFGGGFIDEEVRPGLYLIKAFSNMSPFPALDSAKATFERRADKLCGASAYTIINSNLKSYASSLPNIPVPKVGEMAPPRVTFMAGHVLCANSGITEDEARKILFLN